GRRRQEVLIGDDLSNEPQIGGAPGIEGPSQQDQLGRAEVADPRRNGAARAEFRHHGKIDEGHLEFRALAGVYEVAVRLHGVPPPMAAPCTAATTGLSKSINAVVSRACGESPGPG